jgi:hypothetical protein
MERKLDRGWHGRQVWAHALVDGGLPAAEFVPAQTVVLGNLVVDSAAHPHVFLLLAGRVDILKKSC